MTSGRSWASCGPPTHLHCGIELKGGRRDDVDEAWERKICETICHRGRGLAVCDLDDLGEPQLRGVRIGRGLIARIADRAPPSLVQRRALIGNSEVDRTRSGRLYRFDAMLCPLVQASRLSGSPLNQASMPSTIWV